MSTSCNDVCDAVIERLAALGFDVVDGVDHDKILLALKQCRLERISDLATFLEMGIIYRDETGDYMAVSAKDGPDGEPIGEVFLASKGYEDQLEEWLKDHPPNTWTEDNRWPAQGR